VRAGAEYSRTTLIWFRRQENAEVIAFVDEGSEAGVAGEADRQARSREMLPFSKYKKTSRLSSVCCLFPVSARLSVFGRYSVSSDNLSPGYFVKAV